jgi:hypothetical protein
MQPGAGCVRFTIARSRLHANSGRAAQQEHPDLVVCKPLPSIRAIRPSRWLYLADCGQSNVVAGDRNFISPKSHSLGVRRLVLIAVGSSHGLVFNTNTAGCAHVRRRDVNARE